MRLFGDLCFDHYGHGAFSLRIPSFHFLFSSSSPHRRVHLSRGQLKLRPVIATTYRVTFLVSAAQSTPPQSDDLVSDDEESQGQEESVKPQASTSSSASFTEGQISSIRSSLSASSSSSSSLSGTASTPSGNSATVEFIFESCDGNQASAASLSCFSWTSVSQTQSSIRKITGSALYSMKSSFPKFKKLSHMSRGVKTAFDVFQGWKVIQKFQDSETVFMSGLGSSGRWMLLSIKATKFFAKGLKMSQKVLSSSRLSKYILEWHLDRVFTEKLVQNDLASLARGFNAFYAAFKIAQFTSSIGKKSQQEGNLPDLGSLWKGFKFSKTLVSFVDAVVGKNGWAITCMGKGFFIIKKAMGGVSVMVKAVFLSRELGPIVLQRLAISGGTFAAILKANRREVNNPRLPTLVKLQQSTSKGFSSIILFENRYIGGELPIFASDSFPFCSSVGSLSDSFCGKHYDEDELMTVFCLAIPLQINHLPVPA